MITQFNFERSDFDNFALDFLFVLKPIQGSLEDLGELSSKNFTVE